MVDENGQQFAAKDGDYMLTGFGLITVKDGLITEAVKEEPKVVEPTPEVEVEVESTKIVEPNAPVKAEVTPMDLESIKAMLQPVANLPTGAPRRARTGRFSSGNSLANTPGVTFTV